MQGVKLERWEVLLEPVLNIYKLPSPLSTNFLFVPFQLISQKTSYVKKIWAMCPQTLRLYTTEYFTMHILKPIRNKEVLCHARSAFALYSPN